MKTINRANEITFFHEPGCDFFGLLCSEYADKSRFDVIKSITYFSFMQDEFSFFDFLGKD